jgi:hypothetical protein
MKISKPFIYCYAAMVGVNFVSFAIDKLFHIYDTGSKPSIWELFVVPFFFLLLVAGVKKLLCNRNVYLIVPFFLLIIKFLLIAGNDMNGWDAVWINANLIFYPTSIISYLHQGAGTYWFDVCNFIIIVFLYELAMLKIFKL